MFVYRITNKITGDAYIGSTSRTLPERWANHRHNLRHNKHINPHLQAAWNKYGERVFEWVVLEENIEDYNQLIEKEQSYLDIYRSIGKVYNCGRVVTNGMQGRRHSVESRRKMSLGQIGNQNAKGSCHSEKHKYKNRLAHLGKKHTKEAKLRMSKAQGKPYPAFLHKRTGEIIPAGIGLRRMCREYYLDGSGMAKIKNGKRQSHKGWALR